MAEVDLTCQRCRQPLLQDPTLTHLTQAQYDLVAGSLPSPSPPSSLSAESKLAALPASSASRQAYLDAVARERERAQHVTPQSSSLTTKRPSTHDSFILLSDSQIVPPSRPSASTSPSGPLSSRLFTLLSSRTPVDHPLCTECARALQESLQAQLEDVQRERDAYVAFERRWAGNVAQLEKEKGRGGGAGEGSEAGTEADEVDTARPMTDAAFEALGKRKVELQKEEAEWIARLRTVEDEEAQLRLEEAELEREEQELEREEVAFLQQHAMLQSELTDLRAALRTEQTLHLLATQTLARLEATNVYNDVFQIGHVPLITSAAGEAGGGGAGAGGSGRRRAGSGGSSTGGGMGTGMGVGDMGRHGMITPGTTQTVGTINGLRLGGRPWVDWPEINAALGLVALCIDRIAAKVGCAFETYKIVPLGSFSRIDELPPSKNSYELHASSDMTPARLLQNRRFNYALLGLLDCLRQLVAFGKAHRRGWDGGGLEITKDKINDHPIRLSFGMGMSTLGLGPGQGSKEEESWTRALRAVLAVLKRILVMESEADREGVPAR